MKAKRLFTMVILALVLAAVAAPVPAAARAVWTDFTGSETGETIYPGTWVWLPNGNVHIRGMVSVYEETASDPLMSGTLTSVMNANWGPNFAGPMWGTGESVLESSQDCPAGGVWEATWTGTMNPDGSYTYTSVGRGVSGCVDGLHFILDATNAADGTPTTYTGTILDPFGE